MMTAFDEMRGLVEQTPTRSTIFKAYHWIKKEQLPWLPSDAKRLNRALGIAQSDRLFQRALTEYGSRDDYCGCPDQEWRRVICKHQLAVIMRLVAWRLEFENISLVRDFMHKLEEQLLPFMAEVER